MLSYFEPLSILGVWGVLRGWKVCVERCKLATLGHHASHAPHHHFGSAAHVVQVVQEPQKKITVFHLMELMMCNNGVCAWPVVIRDRCGLCGTWHAACGGSACSAPTRLLLQSWLPTPASGCARPSNMRMTSMWACCYDHEC
eukprot:3604600-Amphidinium_carterae.1